MEKTFINTIQNLPVFAERASRTELGNDIDEQIDSLDENKQDDIGIDPSGSPSLFLNQRGEWSSSLAGPCGPMGVTGPTGPTGPCGPLGFCGPKGFCGPSGAKGATGPTGPCGPLGFCGPKGFCGPFGDTGSQGNNGINSTTTGPFGQTGSPGDKGATETGKGPGGATGFCGPRGITNNTPGVRGNRGPQGFCGPKNTISGPRGNGGPCGPSGPRAAIGWVTGTDYAVAGTGTVVMASKSTGYEGKTFVIYYSINNNGTTDSSVEVHLYNNSGSWQIRRYELKVRAKGTTSGCIVYGQSSGIMPKLGFKCTAGNLTTSSTFKYSYLTLA